MSMAISGSSPRVRGTAREDDGLARARRFIPARAGNRPTRSGARFTAPVHPRACGEQWTRPSHQACLSGSSPRVRGTEHMAVCRYPPSRFIPARAGNSGSAPRPSAPPAVHPRACGEQCSRNGLKAIAGGSSPRVRGTGFPPGRAGVTQTPAGGSSPRVRGTASLASQNDRDQRFIPARAGNRPLRPLIHHRTPVHPRACGEQAAPNGVRSASIGSSPRVRGTVHFVDLGPSVGRFIPARAGNRKRRTRGGLRAAVHPRACGEQLRARSAVTSSAGSSPRVRGTARRAQTHPAGGRFIPARAGNSYGHWLAPSETPVHPRACGEQ